VRGQRHAPAAPYPRERPGTFVQEAGWASGSVWTGAENLAPNRNSIPGPFFSENRAFYELTLENIPNPDRPQMTIWRMRIAR